MTETGRLEAIWLKRFKRGPMDPKPEAKAIAGRGLEDNANQGGKRQVTIISSEDWSTTNGELGTDVDPKERRANLMVSGIALGESRGKVLSIGSVRVRIHGETRPCERMDEAQSGLRKALGNAWRGGAYGEILDDGTIAVGDPVTWVDS